MYECSTEMREENARKLQSDAVNRYMKLKENELETHKVDAEKYKNICVGLTLALIITLTVLGYSLNYMDNIKPCEVKYAKPNANGKYILERLR
jgi:CHASE3 domain sensor protein